LSYTQSTFVAFIIISASISSALNTPAVSVVKYGLPVPHPKITTCHFFKLFIVLGLLNLSLIQSIAKELTCLTSIHFLTSTSARAIAFIFIASIPILSALHLSIFIFSISAHLMKFQAQTTIATSIFFSVISFIMSHTLSSIT
jgi:hypothetical protein